MKAAIVPSVKAKWEIREVEKPALGPNPSNKWAHTR
jgi:hypothetical protein